MATLTDEDEGKILVDAEDEELGIVTGVEDGVGYFEPDPNVSEALLAAFGHTDREGDDLRLPPDAVETVTDEEVRLSGDV